ncbi:hypothetical protein [Ammonifex thiophilus]|uniref:hypothetical protein n=1 Tax=Ammonifex thiophilus TaxID=444093 RepID=UPI0014028D2C|nr:hypothetical protein [Ammonifex thiophilus]
MFTGDLLDRSADPALAGIPVLEGLKAPLGVYAVLGNHDHCFDQRAITRSLAASGVELLVNRSVCLQRGGRRLWIIGLDDPLAGNPRSTRSHGFHSSRRF